MSRTLMSADEREAPRLTDERKKALNLAITQIEKTCGKGAIMRMGADSPRVRVEAIPTGAINLDAASGIGGIPRRRVTEIFGPESSGKTTRAVPIAGHSPRQGGRALKFYASVRLDMRRIGPVKEREVVIGNHVRVKVVKNKVAPPFRQAEFDIMFDEGISHESLLVDIAAEANIIEKSGAWYAYGKERIGQGRENAKLYLKDHPDLAIEVEAKVKEHLGVKPAPVAADEEAASPEE